MKRSSSHPSADDDDEVSNQVQSKRRKQNRDDVVENSKQHKLSSISEFDTTTTPTEKQHGAPPAASSSSSALHASAAQRSSSPAPFLPCHLSMLEALHKDDYAEDDTIPTEEDDDRNQRDDDCCRSMVWDYIKLFLNRREHLIQSKAKATRLRGIFDEARLVSNNDRLKVETDGGVGGDGNGEETTVVPPSSSASGNENGRVVSLSFITQSQSTTATVNNKNGNKNGRATSNYLTPLSSFTSLTSPSKKRPIKPEVFSPFSFHISRSSIQRRGGGRKFRSSKGSGIYDNEDDDDDDDGVKSLNLVMRIMKKRCAVADASSEREMKPFLPLVKAVKAKMKELDEALETTTHVGGGGDREMEENWDSFSHADESLWSGGGSSSQSQFCVTAANDDDDNECIERIAKIQSKMWLWNLLSNDLIDCMR